MAVKPFENSNQIVYTKILSDGERISESFYFSYFFCSRLLNRIGKATLKFDTGDMEKLSFDESDSATFKPGTHVQVYAGYVEGKEKLLYDGIVISQGLDIKGNIRPQLVVECRDYTYGATQERKNAVFEDMSDGDIIVKILKKYGLSCKVKGSTMQHKSLIQYYCSDWDFVRARAEANGLVIYAEGTSVTVETPQVGEAAVLEVQYGRDLIHFNGTLSVTDQYSQVTAYSWDPDKQQVINSAATPPDLNVQGDISASGLQQVESSKLMYQTDAFLSQSFLQTWASSVSLRNGLARYQGDFSFAGNAAPYPGCMVELSKMGKRFDGNVFVGGVEHSIERELWHTNVLMGLLPENVTDLPDVTAPTASGFLPGIKGVHIGKVEKIEGDPLNQNRILIKLPLLNNAQNTVWARLCTMYATSNAGSFFFPETGDEVIVGFLNNDPCFPVVLGSMFSKKLAPPYKLENPNNTKAIVTREKLKIEFDEEQKIITISTPSKNWIEINDKKKQILLTDQHKNEILMDNSGILISSSKDIHLKAKGNISMDATGKVEMSAKSDVAISGLNVKASAKVSVSLNGKASAELSASGQTTVKGGLVMIN